MMRKRNEDGASCQMNPDWALIPITPYEERTGDPIVLTNSILRKEVIQPQVPLRLPCYDFTPVADPTVVACPCCQLAQRRRVRPTPMV